MIYDCHRCTRTHLLSTEHYTLDDLLAYILDGFVCNISLDDAFFLLYVD